METFVVFGALLFSIIFLPICEAYESVACSGVTNVECGHFKLTCGANERIHHLNQEYAYKDETCTMARKKSKCLAASANGCCVYDPVDCNEAYTLLHVYNLVRECSGKNQCGPLPAPMNTLSSCGDNGSTYVRIQYDCLSGSDDFSVNMCEKRDLRNTEMSLIFDQSLNSLSEPSSCICETSIIDGDEIEVNYIDVRMMRAHSETGSGSVCSSAALRGEPDSSGAQIKCNESLSEEFNLKANILVRVPVNETTQLRIILENLFVNGKNDSPVLVWLRLKAITGTLNTSCHREPLHPPTVSTQPVITVVTNTGSTSVPPVTGSQNNTGASTQPVSGDDNTAVIVGVLVPVIIAVVAAVVLFIVWKRRHRPLKRRPANQNSYTSSVGSRNSGVVNNAEYDEIRDVTDATQPHLFDPVYELAKETPHGYVNTGQNGVIVHDSQSDISKEKSHTYQNIKAKNKPENAQSSKPNKVSTKSPFSDFKNKKSQLLSFFKRKNNDSLAPPHVTKKPSDASVTSYDHLNVSNPEVRLTVTPAPEDERHPYAHTHTVDPYEHTNANVDVPEPKKSPDVIKRSASPKGVKAVEVGDSYIEFQFGTLDEDGPDFLKPKPKTAENGETNAKLTRPSRPPPKPSSPKLVKTNAKLTESKAPTPTQRPTTEIKDQQTYDYADADDDEHQAVSARTNKNGNLSNSDSRNSAMVYSYADVDNDDQNMDTLSPELVYEDVDENPGTGLRKCSSAQDISCDTSGGYEVPVKGNSIRPISDSHIINPKDKSKPKSAVKSIENVVNEVASPIGLGYVVKELKEIQDLPDLSDPQKLPKELKYANLGLRSPKSTQKAEKDANKVIQQPKGDDNTNGDNRKSNQISSIQQNPETKKKQSESNHKAVEVNKVEEPAIRKGVLSLAKKFEASNKH